MGLIPDDKGLLARRGEIVLTPAGPAYVIEFVEGYAQMFATVALTATGEHRIFLFDALENNNGPL
jgi:hypothetical protein